MRRKVCNVERGGLQRKEGTRSDRQGFPPIVIGASVIVGMHIIKSHMIHFKIRNVHADVSNLSKHTQTVINVYLYNAIVFTV